MTGRDESMRAKPTREQAQREGRLLLLAEDHAVNRKLLTKQFELAGFLVDTVEDGTQALQKFCAGIYGLVFTDLYMPVFDGFQLTAAIREFERASGRSRTPIIALTANVSREDVERCLVGGMDDHLSKPVTIGQLTEKLRQWLPGLDWGQVHAETLQPRTRTPVDRTVLYQSTGSDLGNASEFLKDYCQVATEDLKTLSEARGDAAIADAAHRMKGAALMIGAYEVADIAGRIEVAGRRSQTTGIVALVEELRQAVARVDEYVRTLSWV